MSPRRASEGVSRGTGTRLAILDGLRCAWAADALVHVEWLDDRTARCVGIAPAGLEADVLTIALPPILEAGGMLYRAGTDAVVSSALRVQLPAAPAATLTVAAEWDDATAPRPGILAIWLAGSTPAIDPRALPADFPRRAAAVLAPMGEQRIARQTAAWLDAILATTAQAVVFADDSTDRALVNPAAAALLGLPAGFASASDVSEAMAFLRARATNADALERQAADLMFGRADWTVQNWEWEFDEPARVLRVASRAIRDPASLAGGVAGRIWTFDDFTAERLAARELEAKNAALAAAREAAESANRAKGAFLAHMSHELRTPLNAIIGFARVLRGPKYAALPDQAKTFLGRIEENSKHLLSLINDILDEAKLAAGKLEVERAPVDLCTLVEETLAGVESIATAKGLTLRAELPEAATVLADGMRLKQVLLNLVSNAVKFTASGSVTVRVVVPDEGAAGYVAVADTGAGIAADRVAAIFQPFEQETAGTAATHGGTGLGLSISRQLCELMGCTLDATSEVGRGSEFRIGVPGELWIANGPSDEGHSG